MITQAGTFLEKEPMAEDWRPTVLKREPYPRDEGCTGRHTIKINPNFCSTIQQYRTPTVKCTAYIQGVCSPHTTKSATISDIHTYSTQTEYPSRAKSLLSPSPSCHLPAWRVERGWWWHGGRGLVRRAFLTSLGETFGSGWERVFVHLQN